MTKTNSILNNSDISYYCCNHRTLKNSKDGKRHDLCDCHIIYKVLEDEYTLINSHSKECLAFDKIIYNNTIEVNREINNYNNYKDILIKKLNSDPLISYGHFKKWATDIYRNSDYNFEIKKNSIKNSYYTWRNNNLIFTKYSMFEHNKTLDNKIFLRDYCNTYIYEENGNKIYNHEHAIFISPFQINKIINSIHLYFDGTYIHQVLNSS